jgi:hypothetical protein
VVETTVAHALAVGLVVSPYNASTLTEPAGVVPLGPLSVGTHHLKWNLSVAGQPLVAGRYLVSLEIFTAAGVPKGLGFPPSAVLTIEANGSTSVVMQTSPAGGSAWWVVLLAALGGLVVGAGGTSLLARRRTGTH